MYERHRRHSQNFNQPYSFSNKHKGQTAIASRIDQQSKYGKQNSHDISRQQSRQCKYDGRVERAVFQQLNHDFQKNQKSNEVLRAEKKYSWDRQAKQNSKARNKWAQEIPSFGNTIRQDSFQKLPKQRFFDRKQASLHQNIRDNPKNDRLQNEKIDRYSAKSWDKPILSNMRSQHLKQISKERVLNINKINCKIKNILDKLNEEEAIHPNQQLNQKRISIDSRLFNRAELHQFNRAESHQFNRAESRQFNRKYPRQFNRADPRQLNRVELRSDLRSSNLIKYGQQKMISRQKRIKTQFQQFDNSQSWKANLRQYQRQKSSKSRDIYEFNTDQSKLLHLTPSQIRATPSGYYQYPDSRINYQVKQKRQSYENYEGKRAEIRVCPDYCKDQSRFRYEGKQSLKKQAQNSQINRSLSYVRKRQVVDSESRIQMRRELSQHRLKSGKNLQAQIQKIQSRIQKSKQIKTELNIEDEIKQKVVHRTQIQKRKSLCMQPKKSVEQFQNKNEQSQEISLPKPFLMAKNRASKKQTFRSQLLSMDQLNQQKYEQMTQRKQEQFQNRPQNRRILKLQFSPAISTQRGQGKQLQIFIQSIHKQVQYDSQFRNAKKWFERYLMHTKWQKLQILLKQKGLSMEIQQIKEIFSIDEDQVNPFFSSRQANLSIQELADSYAKSRNFWQQKIYRAFKRQKLVKGGFVERNLDLDKKGSITIEDFIRFINFQGGTFYRTRDMILIFKRISSHFQTSFDSLLESFCE